MSAFDSLAASGAALALGQSLTLVGVLALQMHAARHQAARTASALHRLGTTGVREASDPTVWMLVAMASAAAQALGDLLLHLDWRSASHALEPFTTSALLLVGPALWFYARAITASPDAPAQGWKAFRLHAVPALLLTAFSGLSLLLDPWSLPEPTDRRSPGEMLALTPVACQMLAYMIAVIRRVRRLRPRLDESFSSVEHRQLHWLEWGAGTFAALVLVWIATWSVPVAVSDFLTNLLLACAVGVLGVFGARQRNVFARAPWQDAPADSVGLRTPAQPEPVSTPNPTAGTPKYAKSALAADQAEALLSRLRRVMEADKPFLENDLALPDLAERIGATPHQLSQVLSLHIGASFFEYINRLRVEAVKTTLARPQAAGRPLLEIALECGFGSKTAFNEAFKRVTGMSPSEYRRGLPGTAAPAQE